jgi:hypothetical protein
MKLIEQAPRDVLENAPSGNFFDPLFPSNIAIEEGVDPWSAVVEAVPALAACGEGVFFDLGSGRPWD